MPTKRILVVVLSIVISALMGCATRSDYAIPILSPKSTDFGLEHEYTADSQTFREVVGNLLGPRLLDGNHIEMLRNGDEIFPAMLDAIRSAKRSITFETFVYWEGEIAEEFSKALAERAQAGVQVHVILDWVGAEALLASSISKMKEAGVQVRFYNPLVWYNPVRWFMDLGELDSRTHRKLLVVDGAIGFIGGVGIADQWKGDARNDGEWRDNHYRVQGPVVSQIQAAFIDNWLEAGGKLLDDDRYFPSLNAVGNTTAQAFKSSPYEATELIELMYRIAINASEHHIRIGTPYFVLNAGTQESLIKAAERGVRIQVVVPADKIDSQLVRSASRGTWGKLLEAGVEIYEYEPTMYHNKVMIVDDLFVSIGSANLDNRSFHLNDEANLNVIDRDFARMVIEDYERDLESSNRVTLEDWKRRPLWNRITEKAAWLFRSEL